LIWIWPCFTRFSRVLTLIVFMSWSVLIMGLNYNILRNCKTFLFKSENIFTE
jgi:hypothetical protein